MKRLIGGGGKARFAKAGGVAALLAAVLCLTGGTAQAQPANDLFANATGITGTAGSTTGSNVGATTESCEPLSVNSDDHGPLVVDNTVWFAWTAPSNGIYEFDTVGSSFDTVLGVYTTASTLCDPSLTLVAADDDNGYTLFEDANFTSYLTFTAAAGTTYYICVDGNAGDLGDDSGSINLDWGILSLQTVPSGIFQFTAGTYLSTVNESSDSLLANSSELDPSVDPSLPGAQLTLNRFVGNRGLVNIGYQVTNGFYTNIFETNLFGTNVIGFIVDTNTGNVNVSNQVQNFIVYTNLYGYYDGSFTPFPGKYGQYKMVGVLTNTTTYYFSGVTTTLVGTNYSTNGVFYPTNGLPLAVVPPVAPATNYNYFTGLTNYYNGVTNIYLTNFFAVLATNVVLGTNASDGSTVPVGLLTYTNFANVYSNVVVTNTYGETISVAVIYPVLPPALVGPVLLTNYTYTNILVTEGFYTNEYYTNGDLTVDLSASATNSAGITNFTYADANNATGVFISQTPTAASGLFPTNRLVPYGIFPLLGFPPTPITNGVITNYFSVNRVFQTNVVNSANDNFAPFTGSVSVADLQSYANILVPVGEYSVGGVPDGTRLPALLYVYPTNASVDSLEAPELETPVLPAGTVAKISLLNNTFIAGQTTNVAIGLSVLNFERETFRVDEDIPGYAKIKVNRAGGDISQSVSVQYFIDQLPPISQNIPSNSFPLLAGSDYAIPGSNFTMASGTVTIPAYSGYASIPNGIPILLTSNANFDLDLQVQLYNASANATIGEVGTATLTILPFNQPAGAMDRTWNTDNSLNSVPPNLAYPGTAGNGGTVYAVANQPADGKTIVAGVFNSFDSQAYSRLVRLMTNGYQDTSFMALPNSGPNDYVTSLAIYPASSPNFGKIIIGGNFTSFNGTNRFHVARLYTDGSLDTTFDPGLGVNGTVWTVALASNDQLIIGGQFTSYNGTNVNNVARINTDGSLDTSFNPGAGPDGQVNSVALDASSRVVIGGAFDMVAGVRSGGVARLNTDGTLDTTFGAGIGTYNPLSAVTDPVYSVVVQPDGKILAGGAFANYQLTTFNGIVRLSADGSVDTSFRPGTGTYNTLTGQADTVYAITLQPDGKILIGGNFTTFNETRRVGIARLFGTDGTVDTSFMDTAYNEYAGLPNLYYNPNADNPYLYPPTNARNVVYALSVEPVTTNVIIGGSFYRVGGGSYDRQDIHNRSNVARLIGGATPGPGNIELVYSSYSANKSSGNLFVSLTRTNGNLGAATVTFGTNMAPVGPGIANVTNFTLLSNSTQPIWDTAYFQNAWQVQIGIYGPNFATLPSNNGVAAETFVNVGINNNTNISGNLNAEFLLTNPASAFTYLGGQQTPLGVALGGQASAPFTIIDDAVLAGTLGFSPTNYYVAEGNNATATITITRTNGSGNQVTVQYATSNGTGVHGATNGVDYTAVTGTLTFGIGVVKQTFTVPIKNVTTYSPDKHFFVRLFTTTGGAVLGQTNATVNIINANYTPGQLTFSSPVYATNENSKFALITVNRLGGSSGQVQVNLFTTNTGSATMPTNYIGTNIVLNWNNADATARTVAIPIFDDGLVTSNLTVGLGLTNATAGGVANTNLLSLSPYTNALLYINNVDAYGTVEFGSPIFSVKKYGGSALIPLVRTGGSAQSITVSYSTADGTAVAGTDYAAVTNNITFTNGQVAAYFKVPILNNLAANGLQYLTLNLTGTTNVGMPSTATLNIIDTGSVNETPGGADSTYSSLAGFNGTVYALSLYGTNQLLAGGDFTMADGVTRYHLARLNDDGTVDAAFSYPSPTWGANGSIRAIQVQSDDNRILIGGLFSSVDNVALNNIGRVNQDGSLDSLFNPGSGANNAVYALAQTFVAGYSKVVAGGAFTTLNGVTFNGVGELNADGSANTNFNAGGLGANGTVFAVAVYPTNSPNVGKILIGGDFTSYNGVTNFNHLARLNPDGSADSSFNSTGSGPNGSVRAITLQPNDQILMGGLFTNVNGSVSNYNHIARLNANGTVDATFNPGLGANNNVLSLAVQSDGRIVVGGQFTLCNGVTRNYVTRLNPDGTVDPTINFGTGANSFVAAVLVEDDLIAGYPTNVPDEKIIIGGGFTQYNGGTNDYLARIYGGSVSGSGAFQFIQPYYSVDESGTNITIPVLRTGGTSGTNADGSGNILVPFATSNITAVAGINYSNVVTNIIFPMGEVLGTITIPVIDDGVVTSNLLLSLNLGDPASDPNPPSEIGLQPTAWLTIVNDDSSIAFASPNYYVAKNVIGSQAPITLNRVGGTNSTSTVAFFTTTNGTAVNPTDYTPYSQLVTFGPGVTSMSVPITISNNPIVEGSRTVFMALTNALSANTNSVTSLGNPTNAVLTIIDTVNSPGQLSLSASNYTASAGGAGLYTGTTITVARNFGISGAVSAQFSTTSGSAVAGVDFVGTNGVVTLADGVTNGTFVLQLINSAIATAPKSFTLSLTNATGGATLADPTNALVTIVNTNVGIGFIAATNTAVDTAGYAQVGVQRTGDTNTSSSVNYGTTNGTALVGTNYQIASGTLTFAAGQTLKYISVPLIDNTNQTVPLYFTMGLTGPSAGVQLLAQSNTTVVISAANAGLSFTNANLTVLKSDGTATITVVCSNPGVEPVVLDSNTVPLEVNYATADGSAVAGQDYTSTTGTLVFTNGIGTNTFTVPILYNGLVSTNKSFTVSLSSPTAPGVLTAPSTQTVTIVNTIAGLSFSSPTFTVQKTAVGANITVNRSFYTNSTVSVNFTATNGTAVAGQNFVATNGVLVFSNGVTSQSFLVPVIDTTVIQPDLTVALQLSGATGGSSLVSPSAATLTIHDNTGSYVIPVAEWLQTSTGPDFASGIVDTNTTNTVQFAFRDGGGTNVNNLVAVLLTTNGVIPLAATNGAVLATETNTYGPLSYNGHSVSRAYVFAVRGTNGQQIIPTFRLLDGSQIIGTNSFSFTLGTTTTTFANTNVIVINDNTNASPYPSIIDVSGIPGTLIKSTVTFSNLWHTSPSDIDALVVMPSSTNTLVMAHAGGTISVTNLSLTFSDSASNSLPQSTKLTSGTNKPTQYYPVGNFP